MAAIVGVATAGLIVFLVFGNASREGAVQDGAAPTGLSGQGSSQCGKIAVADIGKPASLKLARENPPSLIGETGQPINIDATKRPDQQKWFEQLAAAGGLCIDELKIGPTGGATEITLSTVDGMSEADIAAFTGAAALAAHRQPLDRPVVRVTTYVGDTERQLVISSRAASAFEVWRRANKAGRSITDIRRFAGTGTGLGAANLRVTGWG